MESKSIADHWDEVYKRKDEKQVSWYQENPEMFLKLIESTNPSKDDGIINIGGGASTLVDKLLQKARK